MPFMKSLPLLALLFTLFANLNTCIAEKVQKVLCFGDSITQGTYIKGRYVTGKSWVDLLEQRSGGTLECINAGRSGRQTKQKNELLPFLKKHQNVNHLLIYLGVNDLHFSKSVNETNLKNCISNTQWMIDKARKKYGKQLKITLISTPGLNVKTVTPHFRKIGFTQLSQDYLKKLAPLYKELAQKNKCSFIDLWGVVSPQNYTDGLHPNTAGQQQTADYVWSKIKNAGQPIKIACIGDSITFGSSIKNRNKNSYPAQLQQLLGSDYNVTNFGLGGRTLLKKGDRPYWREKYFKEAQNFNPNIVIIKLGTNDSKPHNWKHKAEFDQNLTEMVKIFQNLPTKPKVYLGTQAPVVRDRWGITEKVVKNEVIPATKNVATALNLPIIDFYHAIPAKNKLMPDGVHPNKDGAEFMAQAAYEAIMDRKLASSGISLPAIFNSEMVLQRQKPIRLWGWADAGTEVKISLNEKEISVKTAENGRFEGNLPAMEAGGPYQLTFETATGKTVLNHIMVGEVWVCSGQSNMEWPLEGLHGQHIEGSEEAIKTANFTNLRLFHLQRKIATEPQKDCVGTWKKCTPESVRKFTATGFFFGRKLLKELKNVPIGLIMTAWGGTPAEAWTSPDSLKKLPEFTSEVERIANIGKNGPDAEKKYQNNLKKWYESLSSLSKENWAVAEFDDSAWQTTKIPHKWSKTPALKNFGGVVNFRKKVEIPAALQANDLVLELGPVDDMDITYCNGTKIGSINHWNTPRKYTISRSIIAEKSEIIIAVSVINPTGEGGIFGKPQQLKIYPKNQPNKSISLAGEWKFKKGLPKSKFPPQPKNPNSVHFQSPTVLYNGMIQPIVPLSIRGAIWYQGESNAGSPDLYLKIFPNMVRNWRQKFNQGDFPFYYVQIAPYRYGPGRDAVGIRDVQRKSLKLLPNSGMACIMDKTTLHCIHPPQKKEAGERLAYWALAKDYGQKITYSGPLYRDRKVVGSTISISFDHAESGLTSNGKPLKNFEIAGKDGKFHAAKAIIEGSNIVVTSEKVPNPEHVRYCWHNEALAELWNKDGLPASSFRTDK